MADPIVTPSGVDAPPVPPVAANTAPVIVTDPTPGPAVPIPAPAETPPGAEEPTNPDVKKPPAETVEALARGVRRLAQDRRSFDESRKAHDLQAKEWAPKVEQAERVYAALQGVQENPLAAINLFGPEFAKKFIAAVAGYEPPTAEQQAVTHAEELIEKRLAERDAAAAKAREAAGAADVEEVFARHKAHIAELAKGNQESYELVNLCTELDMRVEGKTPLEHAWDAIAEAYVQHKIVLSKDDALKATEAALRDKYGALYGRSKALRPSAAQEAPRPTPSQSTNGSPRAAGAPSNTLTIRGAMDGPVISGDRSLTREERTRRLTEKVRALVTH